MPCVAVVVEGYALARLHSLERLWLTLAAVVIVYPAVTARLAGLGLAFGASTVHWARFRGYRSARVPATVGDEEE